VREHYASITPSTYVDVVSRQDIHSRSLVVWLILRRSRQNHSGFAMQQVRSAAGKYS
jgi:hypothetical protein